MRRFSQKNQLVTLNEINITPLLDLAFVLLIIFIITTPLLEQSLRLNLPSGGAEKVTVRKDQVRTIEINPAGGYIIKGHPYSLAQLEQFLVSESRRDPKMAVYIRADKAERWENVHDVISLCKRLNLTRMDLAETPPRR
jgi:biopolymer transport protein ExbD